MKRVSTFLVGLSILISLSSHAGVAEKKAIRALTAEIETATAGMQAACENAELISRIEVDEQFTAHNIKIAKMNARDFFTGVLEVCADADYRAEISKLQQIAFTLTESPHKTGTDTTIYGEIKLESETIMLISLHVKSSLSNGLSTTVPNVIKQLY